MPFFLFFVMLTLGCESNLSNRIEQNQDLIMQQIVDLDSLKSKLISMEHSFFSNYKENDQFKIVLDQLSDLKKTVQTLSSFDKLQISLLKVPFGEKSTKINIIDKINKKNNGSYTVDLITINNLRYVSNQAQPVYQLNLSTELKNEFGIPNRGLVNYFMYTEPDSGIQNVEISQLIINKEHPFLYLEDNDKYKISGELVLWITGNF